MYGSLQCCSSLFTSVNVGGSDRAAGISVANYSAAGTQLNSGVLRGAFGGVEHAAGSSQTKWHARGRVGALDEYTDALVSLQRQALAGLPAGGTAGWDALFALSLAKARFAGRDSMNLDRAEEDMIAVLY
jgi:hypothetical protein